jgi:crossover junction endodeoxyribonuclease RuvC
VVGRRREEAPVHVALRLEARAGGEDGASPDPAQPVRLPEVGGRVVIAIGIDVGVVGAIALVNGEGELLAVYDMPVLNDGPAKRRSVNAPLLADIVAKSHAATAFVEFVGARPGEGPTGAFAFGRSRGVIEGVTAALGLPVTFLTPPVWKRAIGITPGKDGAKDAARSEAIRRWPDKAGLFARARDDGRAEAALIAVAGLLREKRP